VFSQFSKVEENKGKGHVADYLTKFHEFCEHMKSIDTGLFGVPEQVQNIKKRGSYLFIKVNASPDNRAICSFASLGTKGVLALIS
jgi:hypothetical protein